MAYDMNHISTADTDCETLLKVATPELYRNNAFRILGLPVNVTLREIERHRKKLEMMTKLGIDSSAKDHGYLPLDPTPDEDAVRNAIERLRDPEKRLIDEFFWFWPLRPDLPEDKALELLAKRNIDEALNIWKEHEQAEECHSVSTHNVAVLYHLIALDMERKRLVKDSSDRDKSDKYQSIWKKAHERWQKLLNDVKFWELLTNRIREFNDPRVSDITAKRIYSSLPRALLLINARFAVRAAERDDKGIVEHQIQLMKEFASEQRLLENVLHKATSPIRERIKIFCAGLVDKVSKKPDEANQLARNLLTRTKSSLKVIDMLLPKRSAIRESLHDEIVGIVRTCTIAYGNETADWKECLWLTEQAFVLATTTSLSNRITDDIELINKNIKDEEIFANLKPIDSAPSLGNIYGIGLTLYGSSDIDTGTMSFLTTYYFVFLAIPVFPICRYRVISSAGGYRFLGKAPLRSFDKWHLAISLIILITVVIGVVSQSSEVDSRAPSLTEPSYRSRSETGSLTARISEGKANLKVMELQLDVMASELESLSSRIKEIETTVKEWESRNAQGLYVNEAIYNQSIDIYNELIEKHNKLLSSSRIKYATYQKEFERVNEMIDQYNRGAR